MSEVPKIESEIQKLNPSAIIELFELDTRNYTGGTILRFHAGTNELKTPVIWQGNTYSPLPVEITGFEWRSTGSIPRPKARVANVTGLLSATLQSMDDLIGSKVTRIRTFVKYLDSVNFPSANPLADPSAEFTRDVFFINQKTMENKYYIEFELAAMLDVQGIKLPRRMYIANVCPWLYRGTECGYTGAAVANENDELTADISKDACGKRIDSCNLRFPNNNSGAGLPYGGFPGVAIVRY